MNSKKISIEEAKKLLLNSGLINRSFIAEKMYPSIQVSSANAKLYNKLKEVNSFRLTEEEQKKLIEILSLEIKKIATFLS